MRYVVLFIILIFSGCSQGGFDCKDSCMRNEPKLVAGMKWGNKISNSFLLIEQLDKYDLYLNLNYNKGVAVVSKKNKRLIGYIGDLNDSCDDMLKGSAVMFGDNYNVYNYQNLKCYNWFGKKVFVFVCCDNKYKPAIVIGTKELYDILMDDSSFWNKLRN